MGETKYWTWHMLAGLAILLLLGLHMLIMHLGGLTGLFVAHPAEEAVAQINSQARDANPVFMFTNRPKNRKVMLTKKSSLSALMVKPIRCATGRIC